MNYQTTVKNVNEVLGQYEGLLTLRQIYYRLVQEAVQREIDSEAWEKTRKASEIEKKKLQPKLDRMAAALKKMVEGELSD